MSFKKAFGQKDTKQDNWAKGIEYIMKQFKEVLTSYNIVEIDIHNLRDWATNKHNNIDDTPYGGGGGMVMMVEPIHKAIESLRTPESYVIATTAKGNTYKQSKAKELSTKIHLIILCGRYEGIDQRVLDTIIDEQISIGNFVLTGGEIPAMVITDSIVRLLPEALGNESSPETDSFYSDDKSIQYPIYTKPEKYKIDGVEYRVPEILLSGNHKKIEEWRHKNIKQGKK